MGNPNGHATDPLPVVGVGGGLGKGYRHIELPTRTPVGNLWLSVAHKFGDRLTPVRRQHEADRAVRVIAVRTYGRPAGPPNTRR